MKLIFTFIAILLVSFGYAQNLVPNPGFEEYTKCPSGISQLKRATYWSSPTKGTPDYYCDCASKNGKYSDAGVPLNKMGNQQAHSGSAYAGFIAYNVFNYLKEREYLQVKLTEPLKADSTYFLSFFVSLSKVVGYATDAIGAYISSEPFQDKRWITINNVPQVANPSFHILDGNEWHCISGTYKAKGGEQYLMIGNFMLPASIKAKRTKGNAYNEQAYYYIDDVCLAPVNKDGTCGCGKIESDTVETKVTDKTTESFRTDTLVYTSIVLNNVFFETDKARLLPPSYPELDKLVAYLKAYDDYGIALSGFTDNQGTEAHNQMLSEARAQAVAEYLIKKGIDKRKVNYSGYGSVNPVATNDTPEGRQKNRRVEFRLEPLPK